MKLKLKNSRIKVTIDLINSNDYCLIIVLCWCIEPFCMKHQQELNRKHAKKKWKKNQTVNVLSQSKRKVNTHNF